MQTLYLIRHGETAWSLTGRHTSTSDIPLTAHGEDEARGLRSALGSLVFSTVLTSPLQRAQQTCELAGLHSQARIEPKLTEWNYGEYEGRRSAEISKDRPDWNIFADGCPGGETPAQIAERADDVIAQLGSLDGNVAIFSHGHFGCGLATRWIELPLLEAQHLLFSPAGVSMLRYHPSHLDVRVIAAWNVTAQLFSRRTPAKS